jgi:hypothetical protein
MGDLVDRSKPGDRAVLRSLAKRLGCPDAKH